MPLFQQADLFLSKKIGEYGEATALRARGSDQALLAVLPLLETAVEIS
jgi:hypothetical protein